MGTIGTGQADGAAEQNPAEAWRSKNLVVTLTGGRTIGIDGGRIASVETGDDPLLGLSVCVEPRAGEKLQVFDRTFTFPIALIHSVVSAVDELAAEDGAAKEETAAEPEAEQPAAAAGCDGHKSKTPLCDAIGQAFLMIDRVREPFREEFARQFLAMVAALEITRGRDTEEECVSSMYGMAQSRLEKRVAQDEAKQLAALFLLHTSEEPAVVESARLSLVGVDKQVTPYGIGRFLLTDFQKAGCPPEDLEKLRALIASAPTAAQQQAQQQEGSAAHVG